MKNILIVLAAVFVAAVVVLGGEKTLSYLRGGRILASEHVDANSPMRLEAARVRALLDGSRQKAVAYEDRVFDLQGRAETSSQTVASLRAKLADEKRALEKARGLLAEARESYVISGRTYSHNEVSADAMKRIEECRRLEQDIAFQESLARDLAQGQEQGRKNLSEARRSLKQLETELARLETRNVNADVRLEIAALANGVSGAPIGAESSELDRAFKNYERRVSQKERQAASRLATANTAHMIDYSESTAPADTPAAITAFLGDAPTPAESAVEPGAAAR